MENCCMEQGDAVLSAPAWQFRMLHLAHRAATDALLDKYGVRDCGHPFILFLLEHCGSDGGFAMQKELSRRTESLGAPTLLPDGVCSAAHARAGGDRGRRRVRCAEYDLLRRIAGG